MIANVRQYLVWKRSRTMTEEKKTQKTDSLSPDLSVLAEFQFGPSWARQGGSKEYSSHGAPGRRDFGRDDQKRDGKFGQRNGSGKPRREFGERRDSDRPRWKSDRNDRDGRQGQGFRKGGGRFDRNAERERRPLPEPAAGLRVELRPVDVGLAACSAEVTKHKRVVSLFDFAKVIMGRRERYDLVFMKQEDGPQMIASNKGDHACWLSKEEALKYIWKSSWFDEFYEAVSEDVDPPKGEFQAIGKCVLTGELIGPVNWHGYQSTLINLHRTKFSNMDFDHFKSKIQVEKGEEIVQAWIEAVSKKTVWKPRREGGGDITLSDVHAVEKDFEENHFNDVYEVTDKVFINGSVSRQVVSAGIWAHIAKLSDITRKHPSMLIPNLCHGLARHHMPIFKWKGGHHTGPSRPRALSASTVLADRMMTIMEWVNQNQGKRVDVMLKELCGSEGKDEAIREKTSKKPAKKAVEEETSEAETKVEASVESAVPAEEAAPVAEETTETPVATPETATEEVAVEETPQAETPETPAEEAAPAPSSSEEAPAAELSELDMKRQELVKDLFWLCDQGYVLVFADGRIALPKAGENPQEEQKAKPKARDAKGKKTAKPKKADAAEKAKDDKKPKAKDAAVEKVEAPKEEAAPVASETPAETPVAAEPAEPVEEKTEEPVAAEEPVVEQPAESASTDETPVAEAEQIETEPVKEEVKTAE